MLGINPFDEPNVQEAKDATSAILEQGSVDPDVSGETLTPHNGRLIMILLRAESPGSYFAIQPFIQRTPEHDELLSRLRAAVRFATRLATTAGYGPRYLHSTGQLHKGGPDKGIFLQLTADDPEELQIPASTYGFSTLKRAQALGDLRALQSRGRRVIRLHLGADPAAGLARLLESIQDATQVAPAAASGG